MAFEDLFRLSAHAVILNEKQQVLLVKATYGSKTWGLPGGSLDIAETVHEALTRECYEELGVAIDIEYMSGIYFHQAFLDSPQLAAGTLRLGILKGSQRRLPLSRRRANLVRAGEILLGNKIPRGKPRGFLFCMHVFSNAMFMIMPL